MVEENPDLITTNNIVADPWEGYLGQLLLCMYHLHLRNPPPLPLIIIYSVVIYINFLNPIKVTYE